MKKFIVTFKERTNKPSKSGILPSEFIEALSQEDVFVVLYSRLNLSKDEFHQKYEIVELRQVDQ